ncbi:MAG TPA: hypothetical protein VF219_19495 [Vicinamibacterales bacterium]
MAALVRHTAYSTSLSYGAERYYLEVTLQGAGGAALTVQATNDANNPPGSAEIASITRSSQGIFVCTLLDAYYAVIYASADLDDTANDGSYATIGNWTNLQTSTPATFTIRTWNASGGAKIDPAQGRAVRVAVAFKKTFTGQAA